MKYPHTRVPSWFFALLPELSECELKVMLVIFKHTLGWQRDSDFLSYSQLTDETGLTSKTSIAKALALLEDRGLIKRATKRIPAQHIQVFPLDPITPLTVQNMNSPVHNLDSRVHNLDSESTESGPQVVHNLDTQKKPTKILFKDTNTKEKLTPDQEESLALMVGGGVDENISRRLILLASSRGRQADYIARIVGYVAQLSDVGNPAGMIVSLIERNNDRIPNSNGQQGPGKALKGGLDLSLPKYQHGGIQHFLVKLDCEVCKAEGA